MELTNFQELRGKSTYLSQILLAEDTPGTKYVVKRNRGKLTETQVRFFNWLCGERPIGLLVPLEFSGKIGEKGEEVYEFVELPQLDSILKGLFPIDNQAKYGWNFSDAQLIMSQTTAALGKLHSRGFIHHDVRAENIFVKPEGLEVTLFDYNSLNEPYFLEEGINSWNDVPPEYRRGKCMIDFRFDVYQAGRLFFEMTHGHVNCHSTKIPRIDISDNALEVIAKASHEKPEDRYSDCNELYDAICLLQN